MTRLVELVKFQPWRAVHVTARLGAQSSVALRPSVRLKQGMSRCARERTRRRLASQRDMSHPKVSK